MAKTTEALQVMYEGSLGAVQGVAQALEAHQLKTQEGHAQALDALKPIQKIRQNILHNCIQLKEDSAKSF